MSGSNGTQNLQLMKKKALQKYCNVHKLVVVYQLHSIGVTHVKEVAKVPAIGAVRSAASDELSIIKKSFTVGTTIVWFKGPDPEGTKWGPFDFPLISSLRTRMI